jgi:hypothetical protein
MTINNSTQRIKVEQDFRQQEVLLANHFRQTFKTGKVAEKDHTYLNTQLFIINHADLLDNNRLVSMGIGLRGRINIIKEDLSGITGFVYYLFHGEKKKALKEEIRQMWGTIRVIDTVRYKKWLEPKQQPTIAATPLTQKNISPLTEVPATEQTKPATSQDIISAQEAQVEATKTIEPATPVVKEVALPCPAIPQLPATHSAAPPPPPPPPPPNAPRAPGAAGAPPPLPAVKRFVGEVAEPRVSVTAKELDPARKAKQGERSPAEIKSLVEQEIATIKTYVETMKESLKPVEAALKRSDDITTQLDNLKIIHTPIKQKINNYNQVLEQLNHHTETFGIQIPKEKEALKFPVLDDKLFDEVAAELQKEGKGLSLKFSAEEIQSTLQKELKTLNSQFSGYEKDRAQLQEELKSILNQENNGIKFSDYKTLLDSKTKTVERWERALKNRKDFLTKQEETNESEVKLEGVKAETVAPIEEDLFSLEDLSSLFTSPEEQARKAKVKEIVATIKKLFTIQNFAILMKAATVTPLIDLFKVTISEIATDRELPKEYNF